MNAVSPNRLRPWLRGVLAGPVALIAACFVMTGGAVWLPEGVTLAALGQWWAFLIWLGAVTAIRWAIAITGGYSTASASHRIQS